MVLGISRQLRDPSSCPGFDIVLTRYVLNCPSEISFLTFDFFIIAYALYKKNPKIFILTIPIILQFVVGAILARFKFSDENVFNYQCDLHTVPVDVVYLGYVSTPLQVYGKYNSSFTVFFCFCSISVILAHAALWLVTFVRRKVAGGHAAVVKLVVHEGAWIFVLLSGENKMLGFAFVRGSHLEA